jgi:hypothetical protein
MSVPTYAPILDSEIEPGDVALASIFVRLRNNPLAVFGVDTNDPAPSINPPRQFVEEEDIVLGSSVSVVSTTTQTVTGAWIKLCDDTSVGTLVEMKVGKGANNDVQLGLSQNSSPATWANQIKNESGTSGLPPPTGNFWRNQVWITPIYTAGAFAGIAFVTDSDNAPDTTLVAPAVASGILLSGTPAVAAPNTTTDLVRIDRLAQHAEVQIEHQTVGTEQQVRLKINTVLDGTGKGSATCSFEGTRSVVELKG